MTDVEGEVAAVEGDEEVVVAKIKVKKNKKEKKDKSISLGAELLKSRAEGSPVTLKKKPRSRSTAPRFPSASTPPEAKRPPKPHHSDDDEEPHEGREKKKKTKQRLPVERSGDGDGPVVDVEDAQGGEKMSASTSSISEEEEPSRKTQDGDEEEEEDEEMVIDEEDDDEEEEEEEEGAEKEGRCYTFDTMATATKDFAFIDEDDEDEDSTQTTGTHTGEYDEEVFTIDEDSDDTGSDDDEDDTIGDIDEDDQDDERSPSSSPVDAVTGVVAASRVSKLKLPLLRSTGEVPSTGQVPSPRAFYSPRPMVLMTPSKASSNASRERICDVEHTIEDGQRMVAAGSLQGLVDKLINIDEGVNDFDLNYYTAVLLITHPMYVTTNELLRRVFEAYDAPAAPFPEGVDDPRMLQQRVRTRVLEVLKKWVEDYSNDFKAGCEARELLDTWISKQSQELAHITEDSESALHEQSQLLKKIQALLSSNDLIQKHMVPIAPPPPPAASAQDKEKGIPIPPPMPVDDLSRFCVLDFPPQRIAQQLTYIDFQMFSAVRFSEFFHCAWSKKDCETKAPNLVRLIERFNKISQWIQTSIVRVRNLKKRIAVLSRFIHIAQEFEWLHNFQGMMMVNAALNNSAISRLKHTWAGLSDEDREKFDSIQNFFSPYHNYQTYRQKLRNSIPPIVPFMALFLTDLTFIDENEDMVARRKKAADMEDSAIGEGGPSAEIAAKESHDEVKAKENEDPTATPAEAPGTVDANAEQAVIEEPKELINFQKMELIGKVLLSIKKFQKATYKNVIPSASFQKFFAEIVEVPMPTLEEVAHSKKKDDLYTDSCVMWSLDHIYKYSLIIEPRDAKPPKTKTSKSKKSASHRSSTAPPSLEGSPVKPKKETRKTKQKYATMGRPSKSKTPDTTLNVQQNPLLMQLQARALAQKRTSRSSSIDGGTPTPPPPPSSSGVTTTINPLLAAAAKKGERSYSMPPIILEKSASLSAIRKIQHEEDDVDASPREAKHGSNLSISSPLASVPEQARADVGELEPKKNAHKKEKKDKTMRNTLKKTKKRESKKDAQEEA